MKTMSLGKTLLFVMSFVALVGEEVVVGPLAQASNCEEGVIVPARDGTGTYSRCTGGQAVHVDQQLCVDYPAFPPDCIATAPTSSKAAPPPVVVPPPAPVLAPNVSVPSPNLGCTWVNGYTRKNGTHVSGYFRC